MKIIKVLVDEVLNSCGDCPLRCQYICMPLKADVGFDEITGNKLAACPLRLEHDNKQIANEVM